MIQSAFTDHLSKENFIQEYEFLTSRKAALLSEITSNKISISTQFDNMESLIAKGMESLEDLIEMDICLTKINTFIAMAFLNMVEDHEVEFKYLTRLPSLVFKLHMNKLNILKSITLNGKDNFLSKLPIEIKFLQQLENLDLNHCALKMIPKEIGQLKSLHNLNMDYNQLNAIPIEICQLSDLEELHLRHNHLKELPIALARLARLRRIDVAENDIAELPADFSRYIH
ncbi:MAG: leucine-rich repeat domain-containing protein [Proteobacteria bacterium]|nr:leucine-rich repeat domain-containing protein [Pseudomonadota bacterium]